MLRVSHDLHAAQVKFLHVPDGRSMKFLSDKNEKFLAAAARDVARDCHGPIFWSGLLSVRKTKAITNGQKIRESINGLSHYIGVVFQCLGVPTVRQFFLNLINLINY